MQSQSAVTQRSTATTAPARAAISTDASNPDRMKTAMTFINAAPMFFRPGFQDWLEQNYSIWLAFEAEAIKTWKAGRRHYGANTIIEYLRHNTLLADRDAEYKISDKWTSSIARLFAMMHADMATLFEFKERKNGVVRAPKIGGELV